MSESLLQKLEEKIMTLLSEVEHSRKEIARLQHENTVLKNERENYARRLDGVMKLIDSVDKVEDPLAVANVVGAKPVLVQG